MPQYILRVSKGKWFSTKGYDMSEVQIQQMTNNTQQAKMELLREMMSDADSCFDNFTPEQLWQVKNYLDSFAREL